MTPEERAADVLDDFHVDCLCEHEHALLVEAFRAAIAEEREACAHLAEMSEPMWPDRVDTGNMWRHQQGVTLAAAIRARG